MNYREDIKAYIDGELSPERAEQVRAAIESDSALREDYEFMKSVSSQIQASAKMPEVRGYESAMQAVRPVRRFNWRAGLAIGGAAVLLLVFAGPALFSGNEGDIAMQTESGDAAADMSLDRAGIFEGAEDYDVAGEESLDLEARTYGGIDGMPLTESSDKGDAWKIPRAVTEDTDQSVRRSADSDRDSGLNAMRAGGGRGLGGFGGDAEAIAAPKEEVDRQVIKNANFELRVASLTKAVDATRGIVKSVKGKFASKAAEEGVTDAVWLTLQVPQDKFDEVVAKLRKLGKIVFEKTGANDVTKSTNMDAGKISQLKTEENDVQKDLLTGQSATEEKNSRSRLQHIQAEIETLELRNMVQMSIAATSEINVYIVQNGGQTQSRRL